MKTRLVAKSVTGAGLLGLAIALVGVGCALDASDETDPDEIASAIELENGGLDMQDEAPFFGEAELFERAGLADADEVYADPIEADDLVVSMLEIPDVALFHTTVVWGQIPGNLENETAYDWSGALHVNRGAILVRRIVGFESETDHLLPRDNRQTVAFESITRPHRDGMRLTIIDPDPLSEEPLTLSYVTESGPVATAPVLSLVEGPQELVVDEAGNRMVAVAFARPLDLCEYGFLGGKWHRVAEGRGIILGRVVNALGEQTGYLRGLYGRRASGEQVFFGKYINLEGEFRGLFRGRYAAGHFAGRWVHASGELGVLGGEYRETIPGPETGGHFLGRWAETSCNVEIDPGGSAGGEGE